MASKLPEYTYIDSTSGLQDLCAKLAGKDYIVLDTEFLRERTYRPQLCLVQVKHADTLACIDALAVDDLSAFVDLLRNEKITKVFHAASQDLEIFYLLCNAVPAPIFDTQLAAPLLGYNEQIGYGNLVNEHLNVELSKAHTRADWTRRPLPEQQIAYALDDVIYLEQLYLDMHSKLLELNRLEWLAPEFADAENPKKYDQPAAERWLKVRNIQRYKGTTLAGIQLLTEWRELKARETNQPRNWLLKDDVLCSLAQQQPETADDLTHIRGLDKKTRDRFGGELLELINTAKTKTPLPAPAFIKKKKLNEANQARAVMLNAWVHQRAQELNINPGILAPQKLLEKCVTGSLNEALNGWRAALLQADFDAILAGSVALRAGKNALELTRSE